MNNNARGSFASWRGIRLWPRTLRWRLQMWFALLLVCLLTGFGITIYERQRVNRFRQIDAELGVRVAALSRLIREYYRDAPPQANVFGDRHRYPPEPDMRELRGFPEHRPPPDGPHARPFPGKPGDPRGLHHLPPRPPQFGCLSGPLGPQPHAPASNTEKKSDGVSSSTLAELPLSSQAAALFDKPGPFYFVIWCRDSSLLKRSANAPPDVMPPQRSERDTLPHFRTRQAFREAVHCSGIGECVLAGYSIQSDLEAIRNLGWVLLAVGGGVLALGLGVGWLFSVRALRPIEKINAAAIRISQGNLSERIEVADCGDELSGLANVLNSSFGRLESAFARQQQFTADAAHELRTPLAVIISETQTALARERTAAEYRETVEADLETAQQMRRLTELLLELARFDTGGEQIQRIEVDLAEVARTCVERARPLAVQRDIAICCEFSPAQVFASPERIEQLIANLLSNATDYNKENGRIQIKTFSDDDAAVLVVADTGIGIAAADLPHIFERFYRSDKARLRAKGHTGLGLAICKEIVDAERGIIDVVSTLHIGTKFTVRLPRTRGLAG